jgi:hypothetical protein
MPRAYNPNGLPLRDSKTQLERLKGFSEGFTRETGQSQLFETISWNLVASKQSKGLATSVKAAFPPYRYPVEQLRGLPAHCATMSTRFHRMTPDDTLQRESGPVRKVVQISSMVHREKDWAFIALCDDGSLWLYLRIRTLRLARLETLEQRFIIEGLPLFPVFSLIASDLRDFSESPDNSNRERERENAFNQRSGSNVR